MSTFTLDTSGAVVTAHGGDVGSLAVWYEFDDLSPFVQGYTEAMFASAVGTPEFWANDRNAGYPDGVGFSDLAPETLAAILKDCEAFTNEVDGLPARLQTADAGRTFWMRRQDGARPGFPPLTPYLGEDGLVYLRGAA
jgi:hypothetical protein